MRPGSSDTCASASTSRWSTSPRPSPSSASWARRHANFSAASARPTCPTRRSRSRRAGRSPSATPRCGPPGSPTSASWAGSSTSRRSSRSACTRTSLGAGSDLGLVDAGYYAINSLRLDKGYRAFGSDLTPDYTPLEAGLRFTCKLETSDRFRGPGSPRVSHCGRTPPATGLLPGRRPRSHALGRRARVARRRTGRPGELRGVVGHLRGGRRARLCVATRTVGPSGPKTWPAGPGR